MKRRPRNHRKFITRVIVFLVLGAIINVAVAWGCAAYSKFETEGRGSLIASDEAILDSAGEGFDPSIIFMQRTGFGIGQRSVPLEDPLEYEVIVEALNKHFEQGGGPIQPTVPLAFLHRFEAGWPVRALEARLWDHSLTWLDANEFAIDESSYRVERGFYIGVPLPTGSSFGIRLDEHRILPVRPIWPGFAINTLVYGAALWLLFAGPCALRQWRRGRGIKRGLCPACAYPVGQSPTCTECGAAVNRIAR